jgi:RimJ/RimL family protein N-acetyltransferase
MITTPLLKVRHLEATDYESYCQLQNDARVKQFTGGPDSVSEAHYQKFISAPAISVLAVCTKDDERFIGTCGFRHNDWGIGLEIFLLPEAHGQGLGGELFDAMISHCAKIFPKQKVGASVSPRNLPALKLLESRGFKDTCESIELKSGIKQSIYVRSSYATAASSA